MKKVKSIVEVTSYLLLIVFSTALIYQQIASPSPDAQNIAIGDSHEELRKIVPAGATETLLIAVSPDCSYCEKSMAFYEELIAARDKTKSNLSVIAAVHNQVPTEEEQKALTAHNVSVDKIVQLDFATLKIMGAPAMLLIDEDGEVQEIWKGSPDGSIQKEVLELL